jgi:hypothetical protein
LFRSSLPPPSMTVATRTSPSRATLSATSVRLRAACVAPWVTMRRGQR